MTEQQESAPKIEFPCENYPVKIVGASGDRFKSAVLGVIEKHAPGFDVGKTNVNMSKNGKYQAITVAICAQGESHLKEIFADLKLVEGVQIVL